MGEGTPVRVESAEELCLLPKNSKTFVETQAPAARRSGRPRADDAAAGGGGGSCNFSPSPCGVTDAVKILAARLLIDRWLTISSRFETWKMLDKIEARLTALERGRARR